MVAKTFLEPKEERWKQGQYFSKNTETRESVNFVKDVIIQI